MTPPIFQCREGHAICKDCTEKIRLCPSCRGNPLDVRCRVLDRLAESVGEVSCRYADLGCNETMRYVLKKAHEQHCPFKYLCCLHADEGCPYAATPADLVRHLIAVHDYEEIRSPRINFVCNKDTARVAEAHSPTVWQRQIYSCFNKHFVLRVRRRVELDPSLCISVVALHTKHHSSRYTVSTQGNHRKYSFEGPVWSVRKGFREVERVRDCLILPENIALFLSGGKGSENDLSLLNLSIVGEIFP